jgi:Domain of unknown function DUF11
VIPAHVSVGEPIRIKLVVVNLGIVVASTVRITLRVSGPVEINEASSEAAPGDETEDVDSSTTDCGSTLSSSAAEEHCLLGPFGSGARFASDFLGTVSGTGTITAIVSVTSDSADPNLANNSATVTTTVEG